MNKLSKGLIWVCVCLLVIIFILLTQVIVLNKDKNKVNVDNSLMYNISVSEILTKIQNKDTFVLYIGREDCDICSDLLPLLISSQVINNYMTQYLDITTVDMQSDMWNTLMEKMDLETTQYITEDHSGDQETNTFGYFVNTYGFTPTTLIFVDGKLKDGFIGKAKEKEFISWINKTISEN